MGTAPRGASSAASGNKAVKGGMFAIQKPADICYAYYGTFEYDGSDYSCTVMTKTHSYFVNGVEANGVKIHYYSLEWHVITTKKVLINGVEYAAGVTVAHWGYLDYGPSAYVWMQLDD